MGFLSMALNRRFGGSHGRSLTFICLVPDGLLPPRLIFLSTSIAVSPFVTSLDSSCYSGMAGQRDTINPRATCRNFPPCSRCGSLHSS